MSTRSRALASCIRRLKYPSLIASILMVSMLMPPGPAHAQSPFPNAWMEDARPGGTYDAGVGTVVVESLGALGSCSFNWGSTLSWTEAWINAGVRVMTEFSPQRVCDTLQDYEALISSFTSLVEQQTTQAGANWAGIMLDEEPGFGFSASDIETLNSWTANVILNTSGFTWWFTENQPNGWNTATYNAIIAGSLAAPQVYSSSMATAVNNSNGGIQQSNMVTTWTGAGGGFGNPATAINAVNGSPLLYIGYYWYNKWRPA